MSDDEEDFGSSLRAQLSRERTVLADKVKRASTRSESLLKHAKPLKSPVNLASAGSRNGEQSLVEATLKDISPAHSGVLDLNAPPTATNHLQTTARAAGRDAAGALPNLRKATTMASSAGLSLIKKRSTGDIKSSPIESASSGLVKKRSTDRLTKSTNNIVTGNTNNVSPSGMLKKRSTGDVRTSSSSPIKGTRKTLGSPSSSPVKGTRKTVGVDAAPPQAGHTRAASNSSLPDTSTSAPSVSAHQRRASAHKVAQYFGDPRLAESVPKFLSEVDPKGDIFAKVRADYEYVSEREKAKQTKLKETLQAKPTAEQLAVPPAQRSSLTPLKAVSILGDEQLQQKMQENLGGLPFDRSAPSNSKPARVLGNVELLAQPKVGKVLGASSDTDNAKAMALARSSDSSLPNPQRSSSLRRRTSGSKNRHIQRGNGAANGVLQNTTPQRRMLMRMHSSAAADDPPPGSLNAAGPLLNQRNATALTAASIAGTTASSRPQVGTGASINETEVRRRQEHDQEAELSSMLSRFDNLLSKT